MEIEEPKIEIIGITEEYAVFFIGIKNAYKVSNVKLEGHKLTYLGLLSNFNRLKVLKPWRRSVPDLQKWFRDTLTERGFSENLNPTAYLIKKL